MQPSPEKICIACGKKAHWIGVHEIYVCDSCGFTWETNERIVGFVTRWRDVEWGRGYDIWHEVPQGILLIAKEYPE